MARARPCPPGMTHAWHRGSALAALLLLFAVLPGPGAADPSGSGFERSYPYVAGPFTFPRDEGPHHDALALPGDLTGASHGDSLVEWWYVVMHLRSADGRAFGVMDSFLEYNVVQGEHIFDVTDLTGQRFYPSDARRDQPDLGPAPGKLDVRVRDSSLAQVDGSPFVYRLLANATDARADLRLTATEAPFLPHGGAFPMGVATPATMSWYYVLPTLQVEGTLVVNGTAYAVTGLASMDHEWYFACSCPGAGSDNDWDYFTVRLDDGTRLVAYQFFGTNLATQRRYDARLPDGGTASGDDFAFQELGWWQKHPLAVPPDPATALSKLYSHGWRISLPGAGLALVLRPQLEDQEAQRGAVPVTFWEGASTVSGTARGQPVRGEAYAEIWHDSRTDVPPRPEALPTLPLPLPPLPG